MLLLFYLLGASLQQNILSTFFLCVPYQRGDPGVARALSSLQCSQAVHRLVINVAARCKKQLRDGSMPSESHDVEGSGPFLLLKINVTASFYQLLRDGLMPFLGSGVERLYPSACW